MKRILFDVPRWYIYLHRRARGLPLVDTFDSRDRRFADELFGRLYAGDLAPLAPADRDPEDAEWAQDLHQVLTSGQFARLAGDCKGDVGKAAAAAKELIESLPQAPASPPPSGTARDAADGLDGVQLGDTAWTGEWKGETEANERAKSLAERIKDDERLKRIAMLAGKFKRIVVTKQKTRVKHGADEITDIMQGDNIARLLPSELARFASPRRRLAALRDLMERKCLQYEMTSVEVLGRGPLVLCVDKSGSMEGDKDIWSSAVALALLDMIHRQHRTFILLGFNHDVVQRVVVKPGRPFPEKYLLAACDGGTDIGKVLDLSLFAVESRSVMSRADIVIITDGEADTSMAASIRARAKARDVRITGIGIDVGPRALRPWCDEAHCITDVSDMDPETATVLFGS